MRIARHATFHSLLLGSLVACAITNAGTASAQTNCSRYPANSQGERLNGRHDPQNVILIVLDDSSAADLPGLNLPIEWKNRNAPATDAKHLQEGSLKRPDLNRLAARAFANPEGSPNAGFLGQIADPGTSQNPFTVVPADIKPSAGETAASFQYQTASTDPRKHVLRGFGGLGRLARDGVVFPRHYAPSGRCGPTRASILTGRNNREVGVSDNGNQLRMGELTIAEFLKSAAPDPNDPKPVHRTGLIGKWHIGNGGRKTSSERGFDETFVYYGPSRRHNRTTTLKCAAPIDDDAADGLRSKKYAAFFCEASFKPILAQGQQAVACTQDSQCETAINKPAQPSGSGWACAPGHQDPDYNPFAGFCYPKRPTTCTPGESTACGNQPDKCVKWGKYLGPQPGTHRYACHPDDIDNPLCCSPGAKKHKVGRDDKYRFNKRRGGSGAQAGSRYWQWDNSSVQPCDDDGPTMRDGSTALYQSTARGCRYDTRYYRDAAKNFILRNKDKPFFLYMALHGLHSPSMAPLRVEAHYDNTTAPAVGRPRVPDDAVGFWGALEEVDAALGQIVGLVRGFCDYSGNEAGYVGLGEPCGDGQSCPAGGTCNPDLAENTLILLTADQGRPGHGYGDPVLNGGKSSVDEGGIRVGLQLWSGSDLDVGTPPDPSIIGGAVSSHADLLATVAHAAGCEPGNDGRYVVRACNGPNRTPCTDVPNDSVCVTPDFGTACDEPGECPCTERILAGRSLLPLLSTRVQDYDEGNSAPIEPRELTFSEYSGSRKAVITKAGYAPAAKVCGIKEESESIPCNDNADCSSGQPCVDGTCVSSDPNAAPFERDRQAGSTTFCEDDGDCSSQAKPCLSTMNGSPCGGPNTPCQCEDSSTSCTSNADCRACLSNAKFCMTDSQNDACSTPPFTGCLWKDHPRCTDRKDCPADKPMCEPVSVQCQTCTEAAWKLRATGGEGAGLSKTVETRELYDVMTNPAEDTRLSFKGKTFPGASASLEDDLRKRVGGWYDCIVGSYPAGECSDCEACDEH